MPKRNGARTRWKFIVLFAIALLLTLTLLGGCSSGAKETSMAPSFVTDQAPEPVKVASVYTIDAPSGWFLADGGVNAGPFSLENLQWISSIGQIKENYLVWDPCVGEWQAAKSISALTDFIQTEP